jgi:hypothetical protein
LVLPLGGGGVTAECGWGKGGGKILQKTSEKTKQSK